ncbi:MAG: right-handed parallel beta-helix repeat-containing protein, partial [Candidatus Brocadiaceae bacterium]
MYKLKMDNAMNTLRPHFLPILKLKGDTQTRRIYRLLYSIFTVWLFLLVMEGGVSAQNMDPIYYDTGSPILKDIWVDYLHGNDSNTGDSRSSPLKTPDAAWRRIPQGDPLTGTGYRILLASGDYPASSLPNYMESRYGTFDFPIIIGAADGPMTAQIHGYLNIYDTRYLYLVNLSLVTDPGYGGGGNVIHIEHGDHILMKGCRLDGFDGSINQPQETLKMNQCQYIYIEDCDISGAFWFAFDFVAVEYGHIVGNRIHNAEDDCLVLKGGAACFRIENNEVYNCGTVGLTAGQGTGLEYMVNPWLHYEAYDLKFFNNLVHDVSNAGLAIRGGYNILMAYNTLYRIGNSSQGAGLILASPGARSCDGDTGACRLRHDAGGWGPASGEGGDWIPNRNIYVYNNIFYNPAPFQTRWSHFTIFGPVYPPASSNVPSPALSDKNLQFRGNIVWNGHSDHPLGIEDATYNPGCQSDNPTCNESQLRSENEINTLEPQLINPAIGDFRPRLGGNVFTATSYPVPKFNGGDRAQPPLAPEGNLQNTMNRDFAGNPRTVSDLPGAFVSASSACSLSCTASASQNNGSAPLLVNFTGKATPSNCTETPAFEWDFGDGTTHSILQNPSHTYKKTGVFSWTMDVSLNGARCKQKGTITVSGQTTTTTETSSTTTISSTTTTTMPPAPSAPSYLRAKALSPSSIFLAWRDNSNNETGFKIERTTG